MTQGRQLRVCLRLPLDRFELAVDFATVHQATGVFGPSGAGKSSLLEAIAGLRPRVRGRIELGGEVWLDTAMKVFRRPEERRIGYVPQDGLLFPHLDVRANLLAGRRRARGAGNPVRETLATVAELLELGPLLDRRIESLSGGERQRVAVVRALINAPGLVLADEPTGSLDRATAADLSSLLVDINQEEGVALVVVTHSEVLAERMSRGLVLRDGKLEDARGGA